MADDNVWDGVNGVWDKDKMIFRTPAFLITGGPVINFDVSGFAVPNGGAAVVNILVCDVNYNVMTPESTVSITIDEGKVYGKGTSTAYEYLNEPMAFGPDAYSHFLRLWFPVTIVDDDPADVDPAKPALLEVAVTLKTPGKKDRIVIETLSGTVD